MKPNIRSKGQRNYVCLILGEQDKPRRFIKKRHFNIKRCRFPGDHAVFAYTRLYIRVARLRLGCLTVIRKQPFFKPFNNPAGHHAMWFPTDHRLHGPFNPKPGYGKQL